MPDIFSRPPAGRSRHGSAAPRALQRLGKRGQVGGADRRTQQLAEARGVANAVYAFAQTLRDFIESSPSSRARISSSLQHGYRNRTSQPSRSCRYSAGFHSASRSANTASVTTSGPQVARIMWKHRKTRSSNGKAKGLALGEHGPNSKIQTRKSEIFPYTVCMPFRNKLDEIMAWKRQEAARLEIHAQDLRKAALARNDFRGFRAALEGASGMALIAEVKKASPSAGLIAPNFNPVEQGLAYERAGAHALSVLTDERFFQGHLTDLKAVRERVNLPVLRKDFIVHRHQLWETALCGADCVLLIVAGLAPNELRALYEEARDLQYDVLIEVHDLREMDAALDLGADLIGINNRNLQTFEVSLDTTVALAEEAPPDVVLVSESGIRTRADVEKVGAAGADAILVGETLMRAGDVRAAAAELLGR